MAPPFAATAAIRPYRVKFFRGDLVVITFILLEIYLRQRPFQASISGGFSSLPLRLRSIMSRAGAVALIQIENRTAFTVRNRAKDFEVQSVLIDQSVGYARS